MKKRKSLHNARRREAFRYFCYLIDKKHLNYRYALDTAAKKYFYATGTMTNIIVQERQRLRQEA